MATYYLTSWDAADFTVVSGTDPFGDFNDATNSAIGSIFTVGQAERLTITDGDSRFDETDSDQHFITSSDTDGRNPSANTDIDPEYTYRIRPVGGPADGSQDILIHAFEMGVGPGADGIVASAWLEPGRQYQVMQIVSESPNVAYGEIYICFGGDTGIRTPSGTRRAADLVRGDLVWTADAGPLPVRWIGTRRLPGWHLARAPAARPVRIAAGAIAPGIPDRAVLASPQHRILLRSAVVQRMFGTDEVLVAARHLVGWPGIDQVLPPGGIDYVHFLLDGHHVVEAEGMLTESLLAGPEALRALEPGDLDEIAGLFPMLAARAPGAAMQAARPLAASGRTATLLRRLARNGKPLYLPDGPSGAARAI